MSRFEKSVQRLMEDSFLDRVVEALHDVWDKIADQVYDSAQYQGIEVDADYVRWEVEYELSYLDDETLKRWGLDMEALEFFEELPGEQRDELLRQAFPGKYFPKGY
jgi:hypothetical protein